MLTVASAARNGRSARFPEVATAVAVAVALLVALGARSSALVLGGLVAAAAVAVAALLSRSRSAADAHEPVQEEALPRHWRWIPLAWVGLALVSVQRFSEQALAGESVSRGAGFSPENVLELSVYAAVALALLRQWLPAPSPGRASVVLRAWPVWAAASATWSVIPAYSFVRGSQLLVAVLLAVHTARVLDSLGDDGTGVVRPFTRVFVDVCSVLAIWGFVFPYSARVPGTAETAAAIAAGGPLAGERFAWYGVHTLTAATVLGVAALLVTVVGPRFLRMSTTGWCARVLLLSVAVLATQGRGVIAGLLVAVPVVLWVRGRRRPDLRYLSVAYYAAFVVAAFAFYHRQLVELASRGEGLGRLFNLNGRLPLWQTAIDSVDSPREVLLGSGLGASGVLFHEEIAFAGHAHNSLVDTLIGTGVLGVLLLLAWLGTVLRGLVSESASAGIPDRLRAALLGVFTLLLVNSIAAPAFAFPGFVFTIACLIASFAVRAPAASPSPRSFVPASLEGDRL